MKNSLNIYIQDIKSIGTNWVSAIIICGLIILPSLYAWLNIAATWDPYSQTNQIPVGIVNEDIGATLQDQSFNAGDELINNLKNNSDMNWHFTNRKQALEHLNNGDYFSVIIIPKYFSQNLATVINEHPQKAHLEYYVNEKINSIAPKITSKGASVLVDTMSTQFIGNVNGTVFEIFNRFGIAMKQDLPDIEKFKEYVFTLETNLPLIYNKLKSAQQDVNNASQII
ncbi:MAG TPA: YhgE/Pip domain-containing protein, partial [Rummeliibacillus sp.]|nr:YhgE/Pip domain-containing protein [Rummeliibacillus sp.]